MQKTTTGIGQNPIYVYRPSAWKGLTYRGALSQCVQYVLCIREELFSCGSTVVIRTLCPRYPHFRGRIIHTYMKLGLGQVSLIHECPLRTVPL